MITTRPYDIFDEYTKGINFKNSIGEKGIFEQSAINERFFAGDQWYGANCGNKRPLVRHNIIKRIGEYKLSQILDNSFNIEYGVDGITKPVNQSNKPTLKKKISGFKYVGAPHNDEINAISEAMDKFYSVTANRVGLHGICAKALKNAYISGTGIVYTYWDGSLSTGITKNAVPIKGDIACEVLNVNNVYFGNPYEESVENQPYIIISSVLEYEDVIKEAENSGADEFVLKNIKKDINGKVLVLTKLYKQADENGKETVYCTKVTENEVVRKPFDTGLRRFPIAVFRFEERNNLVYGDSEITYLIPNQIAINRMITANVWSSVTMGMPMMVVNGDTVSDDISNDPGQIIKVFGSNEDVEGAVRYISPPDVTANFGNCVNMLIENTLASCGANEVALGDSRADNMGALNIMRNAAIMPLKLTKERYFDFIRNIALIWADFWITQYGSRKIKISDESGVWYMPFNSERYKDLYFICKATVAPVASFDSSESIKLLTTLLEKGIISKKEYFSRLPSGLIPDTDGLITGEIEEGEEI